jgi:hypothetical protein
MAVIHGLMVHHAARDIQMEDSKEAVERLEVLLGTGMQMGTTMIEGVDHVTTKHRL